MVVTHHDLNYTQLAEHKPFNCPGIRRPMPKAGQRLPKVFPGLSMPAQVPGAPALAGQYLSQNTFTFPGQLIYLAIRVYYPLYRLLTGIVSLLEPAPSYIVRLM